MNVKITARHFKLPDELRTYIEEKSSKLSRFYDNILATEVVLGWEKQQRYVELRINVNNKLIILKEISEDLRKSFDLIMDKAERQLKRHKAKIRKKEKDIIVTA
jgi:putative sigma-54 modulation protein